MFCHKCGAKLPDDSLFCPKCGAKLASIVEKTETRDSSNAPDVDQRRSDGVEHAQSDRKDNAEVTEFLSSLINEVPDQPSNEDAAGEDMVGDGGDDPHWWNRPEAEVGHDVEPKRREAFKWICVAVFVAVAVIFGVFAAVQSYRTLVHDQQAEEASDSGDESGESGDASDDATDSASPDETGGSADRDSSQTYDRGLRDLAACGRPGYFVLTTGDAGKPVARLENTGSTYKGMNEYVDLRCMIQKLGYTGTNIIHDLGDNESWNNSMNWTYAAEGDEFNDADDGAYRKEYSTPKWIGDGTYKVKCFDEDHRSICDFYMTGNTPTPAEMMKDQYKGNFNAVGYDQYRSYNCSAGNSGKLTPCSTIYQEMESGTMQYLPFGIENASDPDDASTYIPVDEDRNGSIDGGEIGH